MGLLMKFEKFEKLPLTEMKAELKRELRIILVLTILIWLVGFFAILKVGWKSGGLIGLVTLLIVLLIAWERH